ncbi:HEAT repeat-containing protein 4 isoform X2 [Rhinoraja longicauda]
MDESQDESHPSSQCPTADESAVKPPTPREAEATDPSQGRETFTPLTDEELPPLKYRQLLHEKYVKSVALNLRFSKDVINSMPLYGMPTKERSDGNIFDLFKAVRPSGSVEPSQLDGRSRRPRVTRQKSKQGAASDKKVQIPRESHGGSGDKDKAAVPSTTPAPGVSRRTPALPEQAAAQGRASPLKAAESPLAPRQQPEQWDEYLVKKLSKRTAQWLVTRQMPKGPSRARLEELLRNHYGAAHAYALVKDETMTQDDFSLYEQVRPPEPQAPVVRKVTRTPLTTYYRVPGHELHRDIVQEPGAVNWTAANLKVKHMKPPPKPKTMLTSKLGKYVYYTENVFEQELYAGLSGIVHHHGEKYKERIILDNLSEYQKQLQEQFPLLPGKWSECKENQDQQLPPPEPEKLFRGLRRWTALPTVADYTMEKGLRPPDYGLLDKPMNKSFQTHENLQIIRNMVTEWTKTWRIYSHWQDITVEELERDLGAMHSQVQLNALATCASGALERPKLEEDKDSIHLYSRADDEVKAVPENLQPLISEALNSDHQRVRLAAAICHVAMEKMNEKVKEILQDTLLHGNEVDGWIAAQGLALHGDGSYPVVNRIILHLFDTPDEQTMKQVCLILGPLSERTTLVHFMVAHQLNSRNWKKKVLACKVLSCLRGSLNMDLTQKIVHLMWNDWNSNVRQAATQSLGSLGLGKKVHDELQKRLDKGNSRTRIAALSCIGQLGVMTGKLMPSFLNCFQDDFIGVRREACLTAGVLKLKDEKVLAHLLRLMQSDHIWKVKAHAIKALGAIGHVTAELKDLLLWALHYENEPGIRMEACHTIMSLNLQDLKVQTLLKEQLLVENDPQVWKDVAQALQRLGGSTDVEEGMLYKIKEQVCTLCEKNAVIWKLLRLEQMKTNVTQQMEWINLKTQPQHLIALTQQMQQLHQILTADSFHRMQVDVEVCGSVAQLADHSSGPAEAQVLSARCGRPISAEDLHYSRMLRTAGRKALTQPQLGKGSLGEPPSHVDRASQVS